MGSSTTTLQSVVDYVTSLGEMSPVIPASGYSVSTALTMGTDVMLELISQRFNFKFNRMKIPPFYTISWQQDYAQLTSLLPGPIGWLEHGYWVDINNTALPKPSFPVETVRDLEYTSISGNPPGQVAWQYNNQLTQGAWPGPNTLYVNPVGVLNVTPTNPPINILDANGNILVLTTFGTTGATAPAAPANSAEGVTVDDGSCVWTVAAPLSQGFRIRPLPPQQGVCYQINLIAQQKAPPPFTNLNQFINPIPDDYAHYFRDGFQTYCYKMSPDPAIRKMFPVMKQNWLASITAALKQGDHEADSAGFIPDRTVVAPQGGIDIGPANPYLYNVWPGR
jgi:hypothetical protein